MQMITQVGVQVQVGVEILIMMIKILDFGNIVLKELPVIRMIFNFMFHMEQITKSGGLKDTKFQTEMILDGQKIIMKVVVIK